MAPGVPVIASDCGGTREILAPSTDPSYETKKVEFAEYGILLPVFNEQVNRENRLTSVEKNGLNYWKSL